MITGNFFVGAREGAGRETYRAFDAATGTPLEPPFHVASLTDVDRACELAAHAFDTFRETGVEERARFLEAIADNIAGSRRRADRACDGRDRAAARCGSRASARRTIGQLRLFAGVVREGSWLDAAHRPGAAGAHAAAARRTCGMRKVALGPGRGVRRQQLPAGLLGGRRRHRLGARRGLPGGRQGPRGPPGHRRAGRPRHRAGRRRLRPAAGRVLAAVSAGDRDRQGAGRRPAHQGRRLHRLARAAASR